MLCRSFKYHLGTGTDHQETEDKDFGLFEILEDRSREAVETCARCDHNALTLMSIQGDKSCSFCQTPFRDSTEFIYRCDTQRFCFNFNIGLNILERFFFRRFGTTESNFLVLKIWWHLKI